MNDTTRGIDPRVYIGNDVYREISERLTVLHGVPIFDHIDTMLELKATAGLGFDFAPKSSRKLINALEQTGSFAHDDRSYIVERAAAAVTDGEGYREIGDVSLHFQIAPDKVNVHLDQFGFAVYGPDGTKYFNPELMQHIADDLGVGYLREFFAMAHPSLGRFADRWHLIIGNAMNKYRVGYGVQFDIARGRSNRSDQRWKLTFDFDHSCRDRWCQEREKTWMINFTVGRTPSDTTTFANVPSPRDLYKWW